MGTALHRATIGFFVAPLVAAALVGLGLGNAGVAGFSLFILYPVTLIVVLPLFLLFRRLKWLRWWDACAVGAATALFIALEGFSDFSFSRMDAEEVKEVVIYLSVGTGAAFIFWCIAVFREPAYAYVPRRFPVTPLVICAVLVATGIYLRLALEPVFLKGKITALLPADHGQPRATVELDEGATVQADMLCYSSYTAGDEVTLNLRQRSRFIAERYWIADKVRMGKFDSDAYLAEAEKCVEEARAR